MLFGARLGWRGRGGTLTARLPAAHRHARLRLFGKLLGIPGLRAWRVGRFPLPWCHFERGDHLDVVRLLGERQDIPAILGDEFAYRAMLPR